MSTKKKNGSEVANVVRVIAHGDCDLQITVGTKVYLVPNAQIHGSVQAELYGFDRGFLFDSAFSRDYRSALLAVKVDDCKATRATRSDYRKALRQWYCQRYGGEIITIKGKTICGAESILTDYAKVLSDATDEMIAELFSGSLSTAAPFSQCSALVAKWRKETKTTKTPEPTEPTETDERVDDMLEGDAVLGTMVACPFKTATDSFAARCVRALESGIDRMLIDSAIESAMAVLDRELVALDIARRTPAPPAPKPETAKQKHARLLREAKMQAEVEAIYAEEEARKETKRALAIAAGM